MANAVRKISMSLKILLGFLFSVLFLTECIDGFHDVSDFGGLSIQFLEDSTTYFPENITFDEKGRILSFFIEDSKFRPCN